MPFSLSERKAPQMQPTKPTQRRDFEIHVGFSREDIALADRLSTHKSGWSFAYVQEVVVPLLGHGMYDGHDVPGHLGLLATKRRSNYADALGEVDSVAATFKGCTRVRIELEEVLLTHVGSDPGEPLAPIDCSPTASDLVHAALIADTPPFEIHFGVYQRDAGPLKLNTAELVQAFEQAEVPIHEAVRFSSKPKITTTTFFPTQAQILAECAPLASRVGRALADTSLYIKIAAERIVLCAKPRTT